MWDVRERKESRMTVRYPFLEERPELSLAEMKRAANIFIGEMGKSGMF